MPIEGLPLLFDRSIKRQGHFQISSSVQVTLEEDVSINTLQFQPGAAIPTITDGILQLEGVLVVVGLVDAVLESLNLVSNHGLGRHQLRFTSQNGVPLLTREILVLLNQLDVVLVGIAFQTTNAGHYKSHSEYTAT